MKDTTTDPLVNPPTQMAKLLGDAQLAIHYAEHHQSVWLGRRIDTCTDGLCPQLIAALRRDADSLDAAWAEAEAALPEGWWIETVRRHGLGSRWYVDFGRRDDFDLNRYIVSSGPEKSTPAAALRALAATIREKMR